MFPGFSWRVSGETRPQILARRRKIKLIGEDVEIVFDTAGQMKAGFEGKGIVDSKSPEMTGVRRFIQIDYKDKVEVLVPGICAVGLGDGTWTSRFPIAGKPWVEFGMRVPNLIGPQSNIRVRVNWDKKTGYETSFFNSVSYVSGGLPKACQPTQLKEYQPPAYKWFPRKDKKSGLKVGFGVRDGKCSVSIGSKEVASLSKAFDKGGRVSITFSKLTFTLDNLKISGKLDRKWAESRIEELKKAGTLKLKEDPPQVPGAPPPEGQPQPPGG